MTYPLEHWYTIPLIAFAVYCSLSVLNALVYEVARAARRGWDSGAPKQ